MNDRMINELIKKLALNGNSANNKANIQALKDMSSQEIIILYNTYCS